MTEFLKKKPKKQHLSTVPKSCSNITYTIFELPKCH